MAAFLHITTGPSWGQQGEGGSGVQAVQEFRRSRDSGEYLVGHLTVVSYQYELLGPQHSGHHTLWLRGLE